MLALQLLALLALFFEPYKGGEAEAGGGAGLAVLHKVRELSLLQ